MDASEFFGLVRNSLRYLIDEYDFSVGTEKVFPRFDQAEIILQAAACRMRVGRDRGAVYLGVSSALSPNRWHDLATLLAYLT